MVMVAVTATTNNAKCMTLLALHVVLKHKFLSVQAATVLYIAEIALARTARMSESPCLMTGAFFIYPLSLANLF
jgi:hypothetical protein